jgi:hypothetical protein
VQGSGAERLGGAQRGVRPRQLRVIGRAALGGSQERAAAAAAGRAASRLTTGRHTVRGGRRRRRRKKKTMMMEVRMKMEERPRQATRAVLGYYLPQHSQLASATTMTGWVSRNLSCTNRGSWRSGEHARWASTQHRNSFAKKGLDVSPNDEARTTGGRNGLVGFIWPPLARSRRRRLPLSSPSPTLLYRLAPSPAMRKSGHRMF